MAKFYMWSNNGVVAVVSEAVFQEMECRRRIVGEARAEGQELYLPPVRPIFTFSDTRNPGLEKWLTGSLEDMHELLRGHEVVRESFYVPFSNGYQWGIKALTGDDESAERERKCRTSLREAIDTFGLAPKHLIEAGVR